MNRRRFKFFLELIFPLCSFSARHLQETLSVTARNCLAFRTCLCAKLLPFVLHDTWQFRNFWCNLSELSILVRRHSVFVPAPRRYKYVAESFFVHWAAWLCLAERRKLLSAADTSSVTYNYLVFVIAILKLLIDRRVWVMSISGTHLESSSNEPRPRHHKTRYTA